jgi:hypothetical protein
LFLEEAGEFRLFFRGENDEEGLFAFGEDDVAFVAEFLGNFDAFFYSGV